MEDPYHAEIATSCCEIQIFAPISIGYKTSSFLHYGFKFRFKIVVHMDDSTSQQTASNTSWYEGSTYSINHGEGSRNFATYITKLPSYSSKIKGVKSQETIEVQNCNESIICYFSIWMISEYKISHTIAMLRHLSLDEDSISTTIPTILVRISTYSSLDHWVWSRYWLAHTVNIRTQIE